MPKKPRDGKFKLKTHKATSKRFRLTASGLLVRTKGGKSHLRRNTSTSAVAFLAASSKWLAATEAAFATASASLAAFSAAS